MQFRDSLWRKSSYSSETADCVEIAYPDWHKSSYSTDQTNCVEVSHTTRTPRAGVRDSKNPNGGHLAVTSAALHNLLHTVTR